MESQACLKRKTPSPTEGLTGKLENAEVPIDTIPNDEPQQKIMKLENDVPSGNSENSPVEDKNAEEPTVTDNTNHNNATSETVTEILSEPNDTSVKSDAISSDSEAKPQLEILKIEIESTKISVESQNTENCNAIDNLVDEGVTDESSLTLNCNKIVDESSILSIKFRDIHISKLYKEKFFNFLSSFSEFKINTHNELCIEVEEKRALDDPVAISQTPGGKVENASSKRKKHSKAKRELFILDAKPSDKASETDLQYTSKFIWSTEKERNSNKSNSAKQQTCFNCDKPHALKDCPERKDYTRINAARQKFFLQSKSLRYHLEEEQKYGHLVPGKLSNELRKAMGLRKTEIPHYVYQMRRLGYPPGWLEEAKFVHSNLDIFDSDGSHLKISSLQNRGLDPEKIVNYPGFNVPLEKGARDDFKFHRVPPFSEDFSKEMMINYFNEQIANEEDNSNDMDINIDTKLLPENSAKQKQQLNLVEASKDSERNSDSPSLRDLEQQKLQLLEELQNAASTSTTTTKDEENKKDTVGGAEAASDSSSNVELKNVKTSTFGTPILKSSSPYMSLPNADNFSKDVSPVINFENLPNSTGKYEQMTDVLQKVRCSLKKIHNADT